MKLRTLALLLAFAVVLAGCSLAGDVTPPPDYNTPTPAPTLSGLVPSAPPSPAAGAAFFTESCAPCHGSAGLGNGPMAGQLPVAVPAIGLRDISSQSSPTTWYELISNGRLDRGMPGFIAHPESERWDVLAYVYTLSTTPEETALGAELYTARCASCHGPQGDLIPTADLTDQAFMSSQSGTALYRSIAEGNGTMPAFADQLSQAEIWALTAYLRLSTFDRSEVAAATSVPTENPEVAAATPQPAQEESPALEASPAPATQSISVSGLVTNGSGTGLPAQAVATLHIFDLQGNQEVDSQELSLQPDGSFLVADLPPVENVAYWVSVEHQGVSYSSQPGMYDGSSSSFDLPVTVYDSTADQTVLSLDQVHVNLSPAEEGMLQVVEIYILSNPGVSTVIIPSDGTSVPFIQLPAEAAGVQYQLANGSEPLLGAEDGFAMPPSSGQYGIVAMYTLPYGRRLDLQQSFPLPVNSLVLFVPEGMKVRSDQLTDGGVQDFQGQTFTLFQADNLAAGGTLSMTISGKPGTAGGFVLDQRTGMLIGLGALGLLLIVAGVYLYIRDRRLAAEEEEEDLEEEDALGDDQDAILDAILALDDRFQAGEIAEAAYQARRQELKSRLKTGQEG
jgi:mono/diheme cytochrome c family protein